MTFVMTPVFMTTACAGVPPTLNQCTTNPQSLIDYLRLLRVQGKPF